MYKVKNLSMALRPCPLLTLHNVIEEIQLRTERSIGGGDATYRTPTRCLAVLSGKRDKKKENVEVLDKADQEFKTQNKSKQVQERMI